MVSKGEEKGRLLFTDSLSGIERIRVEGSSRFLMLVTLFFSLVMIELIYLAWFIYDTGRSPLMPGLLSVLIVLMPFLPIFLFQALAVPVKIYSNGIEEPDFFPFDIITSIQKKHDTNERFSIFSLDLETGSTVKFHIKNDAAFIAALEQAYGEEKWKDVFKDEK